MKRRQRLYRKVLMPVGLVLKNHHRSQPLKRLVKYTMLKRGFISESALLYGLNRTNYKHYLSDYQIMKSAMINRGVSYSLNNKVAFVDLLEGVVEIPKTIAVIKDGQYIPRTSSFNNLTELLAYLKKDASHKVVLKPIDGAEGRGVFVVRGEQGNVFLNEQLLTAQEFENYLSTLDDYYLSEFIQQGHFASELYAGSLNTIRMLTMVNPITQQAFIAASVFRVGTSLSAPMDNFRRHGLSVTIDGNTGRLGNAVMAPINGKVRWYEKHPDTGIRLTGQVIPNWSRVKEQIIQVSNFINQAKGIRYVGWDVVLTDDGIMILEGNSVPGVSLHQVHQPLLIQPRVRVFYEFYGVL